MELLKTRDVAKMLGVHRAAVNKWCEQGVGPQFIRTPRGHYRFERQAVEEWLRNLRSGQMKAKERISTDHPVAERAEP